MQQPQLCPSCSRKIRFLQCSNFLLLMVHDVLHLMDTVTEQVVAKLSPQLFSLCFPVLCRHTPCSAIQSISVSKYLALSNSKYTPEKLTLWDTQNGSITMLSRQYSTKRYTNNLGSCALIVYIVMYCVAKRVFYYRVPSGGGVTLEAAYKLKSFSLLLKDTLLH